MSAEAAIKALKAIESLSKLMDLYDEFEEEEEPKTKRTKKSEVKQRIVYVKSEDVEANILKNITWINDDEEDIFCAMTMDNFEELHSRLASKLKRKRLIFPHISIKMRLALTLRYLVNGDTHANLQKISHIPRKCTMRIIPDMMEHIINIFYEDYLKLPLTQDKWHKISNDFASYWNFPHTLGVLDARTFFYRSLETEPSSLILLSVLDAHSRFQYVEIIENNSTKNSTVYKNSRLYDILKKKRLNIPTAVRLPGQIDETPYFFVASDIFNMDRFVLQPYNENMKLSRSQQAFNFRINRAKTPSQLAFDIMLQKFKIFNKLCDIKMYNVKLIIRTCCILHNFLKETLTKPLDFNENLEIPASALRNISQQTVEPYEQAVDTRENICNYCVNEGNIDEQWWKIIKTESGEEM